MSRSSGRGGPSLSTPAIAAATVVQGALALAIGLPGQLSYDSIVQLYEGRTGHFISIHPPLMSVLLGALDRVGDAASLFVVLSTVLLCASTWLVLSQARVGSAARFAAAALALLNPVVLIYAGIVWKDVLLAHTVVFLYLLLATLRERHVGLGAPLALVVLALLIIVVGSRQQGALFAVPAALWAATLVGRGRSARVLTGVLLVVLPIALVSSMQRAIRASPDNAPVYPVATGFRGLMQFDLAGILASGGALPTGTSATLARELEDQSLHYSKYRSDSLVGPANRYWSMTDGEARSIWMTSIAENMPAYLAHRSRFFLALLGFRDMRQCVPVFSGVAGPVVHVPVPHDLTRTLGLSAGPNRTSAFVNHFGWRMANTPLFMHGVSAVALLLLAVWLFVRREYVLLTLAVCSLLFLASYLVLGIACDFRYAYSLTLAASMLLAYAALRPPVAH